MRRFLRPFRAGLWPKTRGIASRLGLVALLSVPVSAQDSRVAIELVLALDSGVDVLGRSVGGDVGVGFGFSDFEFVARFVPGRVLAAGLTIDYAPRIGIFAPVIGVEGTDYFKASAVAGGPLLGVRFYLAGGFSLGAQAALEFNSASAPYRDRALLALLHLQYDLPF